jgi:hypothetical protein
MQTALATVGNQATSAAIETFQLAIVTTKNVRTKYDIEVAKRTLAAEDIQAMTEVELHDAHGHAVVATVSSFINRVRLLPEIYKRFEAGKIVGGCSDFKSYVVMYKATGEASENAVRKAYYALKYVEKESGTKLIANKKNAGRKPAVKVKPSERVFNIPSGKTEDEAKEAADKQVNAVREQSAFERGKAASRCEIREQLDGEYRERNLLQAKAQDAADGICLKLASTVSADEFKKMLPTLRTAAKAYLKMRGIPLTTEAN